MRVTLAEDPLFRGKGSSDAGLHSKGSWASLILGSQNSDATNSVLTETTGGEFRVYRASIRLL